MNKSINILSEEYLKTLYFDTNMHGCKVDDLEKLIFFKVGLKKSDCLELFSDTSCCNSDCKSKSSTSRYNIIEAVKPITLQYQKYESYKKARVVSDNQEKFFRDNPLCATYEKWEKIAKGICYINNIKIVGKATKTQCDLSLDISMQRVKPECIILLQAVKELQKCDSEIKISRKKDQCKIDYNILVERYHNQCEILSFTEYQTALDGGFTFDIMDTLYKNNNQLELKGGKVYIKGFVSSYTVDDIECWDEKELGKNRELLKEAFKDIELTAEQKAALHID